MLICLVYYRRCVCMYVCMPVSMPVNSNIHDLLSGYFWNFANYCVIIIGESDGIQVLKKVVSSPESFLPYLGLKLFVCFVLGIGFKNFLKFCKMLEQYNKNKVTIANMLKKRLFTLYWGTFKPVESKSSYTLSSENTLRGFLILFNNCVL